MGLQPLILAQTSLPLLLAAVAAVAVAVAVAAVKRKILIASKACCH